MIVSDPKKIITFDSLNPCPHNLYSPVSCDGRFYFMGGHIDGGTDFNLNSYKRFADRIWLGSNPPVEMINKSFFPWMNGSEWLSNHLSSFVGSVASPSILKLGGMYFMAFTASINDPNVCTGEHNAATVYGSCVNPWSYFVVYWATSPDGFNWTLQTPRNINPNGSNPAIDNSAFYYIPKPEDCNPSLITGGTKGTGFVSLYFEHPYIYFLVTFWSAVGVKCCLFRVTFVNAPAGHLWNFEVFDNFLQQWFFLGGDGFGNARVIPDWLNNASWRGSLFGTFAYQIAKPSILNNQYMAVLTDGSDSHLSYAVSNTVTGFIDEKLTIENAPSQIITPSFYEDSLGQHFLYAKSDPPCVNGSFYGLEIYQVDVVHPKHRAVGK